MPTESAGNYSGSRESEIGIGGMALRFLLALVVVLLTYNPGQFSYFVWARSAFLASALGPLHLLAGLALLGGWALLVNATTRSLGVFGMVLVAAFFAALVWLLIDVKLVDAHSFATLQWLVLIGVAFLLATGMCWSHIRRRLTGQADVDEINEP